MTTTPAGFAEISSPAPNARRLLLAGFLAILAAGMGFAMRGGIFDVWRATFNFTATQVGLVNGAGFTGFCFGIIMGGLVADRLGYGRLVLVAFGLHVSSALVSFLVRDSMAPQAAFGLLWLSSFLFAVANGTLEGVANPLVATLFPQNRTHYLNILHASWPAGMVLGGLLGLLLGEKWHLPWQVQMATFLIPTVLYGLLFLGQRFPRSEASSQGLSLGEMLRDVGMAGALVAAGFIGLFVKDGLGPLLFGFTGNGFYTSPGWTWVSVGAGALVWVYFSRLSGWSRGAFLLFVLFITHALVGAVELGTDGWMQNITSNLFTSAEGKGLFIYTAGLMFALRFCAHFLERTLRLSPVGLLLGCALIACAGLRFFAQVHGLGMAYVAISVYALGKTFFWPTMLAVASDRFPRTGAVAISIMGGIGMMSAGLVGSQGLGYAKDRFAGEALRAESQVQFAEYQAETPSKFLGFETVRGLDGKKLEEAKAAGEARTPAQAAVVRANEAGDRATLRADAFIPLAMAVIFAGLLLYFRASGGYRPMRIEPERATGGVEGPMQA